MSPVRDLPARPSLDSLRKQAKKLARDAAAGNGEAIARVHAQLPRRALPLSSRDAQLVIAREYGFAGWPDLTAEVQKRLGRAREWAVSQARVAIHDQDYDRLRVLLAEYQALVSSLQAERRKQRKEGDAQVPDDVMVPDQEDVVLGEASEGKVARLRSGTHRIRSCVMTVVVFDRDSTNEQGSSAASHMEAIAEISPNRIMQLGLGFWASKTLLSAAELDLFSELAAAPLDRETLPQRLGLDRRCARERLVGRLEALLTRRSDSDHCRAIM